MIFSIFRESGTLFAVAELKLTLQGKIMLFSISNRDKHALSRRSRAFIRIHHLAVFGLIAWISYLFMIR
jgi:hypothetical protein